MSLVNTAAAPPRATAATDDSVTSDVRHVTVAVVPRSSRRRQGALCESLLGIVAGGVTLDPSSPGRLVVQGLVPGGPAMRAGVHIGEWLMSVNSLELTSVNVDEILSTITCPSEVRLQLCRRYVKSETSPSVVSSSVSSQVELLSGDLLSHPTPSLKDVTHRLMYVTMETQSENGNGDLLYDFPRESSKLTPLRGLFATLANLLDDVTNSPPTASTLTVDDELVHVGYRRENRELMLLAVPAQLLSVYELQQLLGDVTRNLKVLYGSLHRAFSEPSHHESVDRLLSCVFEQRLLASTEPLSEVLPAARLLSLPDETRMTINNCLSQFEAADFGDMSDSFYGMRRQYSILGCCLLYKGWLLASHVHREDLRDVVLSLRHRGLLGDAARTGRIAVWHEMFPTRRCHKQVDPLICGYVEPAEARWFLMVTGMEGLLLCSILEAGGVSEWVRGQPVPDAFLQEQARATLQQMEVADVIGQLELRLQSLSTPSLACADWFLPSQPGGAAEPPRSPRPPLLSSPAKPPPAPPSSSSAAAKTPTLGALGRRVLPQCNETIASEADTSDVDNRSVGGASGGSTPHRWAGGAHPHTSTHPSEGTPVAVKTANYFKGAKKKRNLLSAMDVSNLQKSLSELEGEQGCTLIKLTSGCENTLFHYVQLDVADGVYVAPTSHESRHAAGPTHRDVLRNFQLAALAIHGRFRNAAKLKEFKDEGHCGKFGTETAFEDMTEYGILFECSAPTTTDPKKPTPLMTYWVIGRCITEPYPREVYVCFHELAQQNIMEMAFKLAFGMSA